MDFYIFESKADALRAFKKTTSWFSDIEEENDDHRLGWRAEVSDAEVESYEYLTGNMIILVDTQVVSSWGEVLAEEDDNKEELQIVEEQGENEWSQSYRESIIDLMRETFR